MHQVSVSCTDALRCVYCHAMSSVICTTPRSLGVLCAWPVQQRVCDHWVCARLQLVVIEEVGGQVQQLGVGAVVAQKLADVAPVVLGRGPLRGRAEESVLPFAPTPVTIMPKHSQSNGHQALQTVA
jgi:hypothetical protein